MPQTLRIVPFGSSRLAREEQAGTGSAKGAGHRGRLLPRCTPAALITFFGLSLLTPLVAEEGHLPAGTSITVSIHSPSDGALLASPPGSVVVEGDASIGEGEALPRTTLVYVLDASGSARLDSGGDCGPDQDGDGTENRVQDCQVAAVKNLNQVAIERGTVGLVGVVAFAGAGASDSDAVSGDMSPDDEEDVPLIAADNDANDNSIHDVDEVVASIKSGQAGAFPRIGLAEFSRKSIRSSGTNLTAALRRVLRLLTDPSNVSDTHLVVFLSDGIASRGGPGTFATALQNVADTGATIHAFAVGAAGQCQTGSILGDLQSMADATGGTCTPVTDPSMLSDIIPSVIASSLNRLDLAVDGSSPSDISATSNEPLPAAGPTSVSYGPVLVPNLSPIPHELCVTASGSDSGGDSAVTECVSVIVATLDLAPDTGESDVGEEHTVMATVSSGGTGVEGVPVDFTVLSGPNSAASNRATTDASGVALFTYTGAGGPGIDVIEACFVDDFGNELCATVTQEWLARQPPEVGCVETTNPHGNQVPGPAGPNGNPHGDNPDGFFELTAVDILDPDPQLFVTDEGTGTVFGPFNSGTTMKYIQTPGGEPSIRPFGGNNGRGQGNSSAIDWQIRGRGDALVHAVNALGIASEPIYCRVPPMFVDGFESGGLSHWSQARGH